MKGRSSFLFSACRTDADADAGAAPVADASFPSGADEVTHPKKTAEENIRPDKKIFKKI